MLARIIDDQVSFIFGHGFIDMPNDELLKALVGSETDERVQMLPITSQKTAHGIAILLGDCSLVAVREALERAVHTIPVSELVSLFLRLANLILSAYFLGCGFAKSG